MSSIDEIISEADDAELVEILHRIADEIELRMMQNANEKRTLSRK